MSLELLAWGAVLGFVDGILNPCALAVLLFLIAYLTTLGLRLRCLWIGFTFVASVFAVYSLFMLGTLQLFALLGYLELIKLVVASIALMTGALSFAEFAGLRVLGIPSLCRHKLQALVKLATLPSAAVLGALVSVVEIPCAGSFPLIYLSMLAGQNFNRLYVLWYNSFFVLPLLCLTLLLYFGVQRVERTELWRRKARRWMRLVAGMALLTLGTLMLLRLL